MAPLHLCVCKIIFTIMSYCGIAKIKTLKHSSTETERNRNNNLHQFSFRDHYYITVTVSLNIFSQNKSCILQTCALVQREKYSISLFIMYESSCKIFSYKIRLPNFCLLCTMFDLCEIKLCLILHNINLIFS